MIEIIYQITLENGIIITNPKQWEIYDLLKQEAQGGE